jgi:esterase/lipase
MRRRRWPWVLLFLGIALVAAFYLGGGWYFSGQVYEDALKAEPYDPSTLQRGTIREIAVDEDGTGTVTILPAQEDLDETKFDEAVIGLVVGESLVVAGPATRGTDGSQEREVRSVVGVTPEAGDTYGLTRDVWLTPEQAGMEYQDITVTTPEGDSFPTWLIPGRGDRRWAVLTHGKGAARSEMLRMARPLHEAGFNVLVITYRGDVGAPPYEDGMVTYGRDEWRELGAAVEYARDQGATTVVLGGASHGGAVTLGFLDRGAGLAAEVDGIILDAPVSSFEDVVDEAGEFRSLPVVGLPIPESLEDVAKWMVAFRYGVDFKEVDYSSIEGLVEDPLLVFQGTEDTTVGQPVNDRFMTSGSGRSGDYVVVDGAEHVLAWNLDPQGYEERITQFLDEVRANG